MVNLTGMILVITVLNKQSIFAAYDLEGEDANSLMLSTKILAEVLPIGDADSPPCIPQGFTGSGGALCLSWNAEEFIIHLSHWNNHRTALYVWNAIVSFLVLILMMRVKVARESMDAFPFGASTLKTIVDAVQFCMGVLVLIWVGVEMYWFWLVMERYTTQTRGTLQVFWKDYERNWYFSMMAVLLSLCFGIILFFVKVIVFIIGYIPAKLCLGMQGMTQPMMQPPQAGGQMGYGNPMEQGQCMAGCGDFFDNYLMSLMACGFRGALWEYVSKGEIPEADVMATTQVNTWGNNQTQPGNRRAFDPEDPQGDDDDRPPQNQRNNLPTPWSNQRNQGRGMNMGPQQQMMGGPNGGLGMMGDDDSGGGGGGNRMKKAATGVIAANRVVDAIASGSEEEGRKKKKKKKKSKHKSDDDEDDDKPKKHKKKKKDDDESGSKRKKSKRDLRKDSDQD